MRRALFLAAVITFSASPLRAAEMLDRFLAELLESVPNDTTNCFQNCKTIAAFAEERLHFTSQTFLDTTVLEPLSRRLDSPSNELNSKLALGQARALETGQVYHVIPERLFSAHALHDIQLTRIAMYLPDLIEKSDAEHYSLKPLRHCFFVVSDKTDATICHAWEEAFAFRCATPMPFDAFEDHMLDLKGRIGNYLKLRDEVSYRSVIAWFLGTRIPPSAPVDITIEQYEEFLQSDAVKFFDNFESSWDFMTFFSKLATKAPEEVSRQITLANFAGKEVFIASYFRSPNWRLILESEL